MEMQARVAHIEQPETIRQWEKIDTQKGNIQSTTIYTESVTIAQPKHSSLSDCFRQLYRNNELYRGVRPIVSTLATSNFIFFYLHALCKRWIVQTYRNDSTSTRAYRSLLASCLAGLVNVFLTSPLWVTNMRLMTGEGRYETLWKELHYLAKTEGIRHLWTGTGTSILLVSNPVIQFFSYEQLKTAILTSTLHSSSSTTTTTTTSTTKQTLTPVQAFVVGAIAKAIATVTTYPLQLTQSVLRLQHKTPNDKAPTTTQYTGTLDCLRHLYREQGVQGLFTGMRAKLLQTVLTAACTFLTYEQILHAVHSTHVAILAKQQHQQQQSPPPLTTTLTS